MLELKAQAAGKKKKPKSNEDRNEKPNTRDPRQNN